MVEVGVRLLIARKTAFANLKFEKSDQSYNPYRRQEGIYGKSLLSLKHTEYVTKVVAAKEDCDG